MATGRRDEAVLAEATTSMAADLHLAEAGAESPVIGAEQPPPPSEPGSPPS